MTARAGPSDHPLSRLVFDRISWVFALWLHVAIFAALTSQPTWKAPISQQETPVDVELVAALPAKKAPDTQPNSGFTGKPAATVVLPPESFPSEPLASPDPRFGWPRPEKQWVSARELLAADVLQHESNAETRRKLRSLLSEEKSTQLCALEAMEQVLKNVPGYQPKQLMPHALLNAYRKGDLIIAPAGALLSGSIWYEIAFKCRTGPQGDSIEAFDYALGEAIPEAEWSDLGLPPVH